MAFSARSCVKSFPAPSCVPSFLLLVEPGHEFGSQGVQARAANAHIQCHPGGRVVPRSESGVVCLQVDADLLPASWSSKLSIFALFKELLHRKRIRIQCYNHKYLSRRHAIWQT